MIRYPSLSTSLVYRKSTLFVLDKFCINLCNGLSDLIVHVIWLNLQIGALEDRRKYLLQGLLVIQKSFRGYRARRRYHELKKGVTTLQSCNVLLSIIVLFALNVLSFHR